MIVYSESKAQFVAEVERNDIHNRIRAQLRALAKVSPSDSEVNAWRNSLQFMANIVRTPDLPDTSRVAIEFVVPLTSKRVDFILTGKNEVEQDTAVIVELKQWSRVEMTNQDAIVNTWIGGGARETLHPSYQAWTYAALIRDYNETVRDERIALEPCAYLHNLDSELEIRHPRYKEHLDRAPAFLEKEADDLRQFLCRHIRSGDASDVMYRIEHGRLRPSKNLADCLSSMLSGNQEFVMVDEQKVLYEAALARANKNGETGKQVVIVQGGPGTGKSVVAINLLVQLTKMGLIAQYVSRNAAPRAVYQARLTGTLKKTHIANLFRGSGGYIDCEPGSLDALIVDEAHRLNEKSGLYGNLGTNQIKELIAASKLTIFFIDEDQRITLKDIGTVEEIEHWASAAGAGVSRFELSSQFRCAGSDGYMAFLDNALQVRETANKWLGENEYDMRVFDSAQELYDEIKRRNHANNKSRLVAGYCWDWASKKVPDAIDIEIPEDGFSARWNLASDGSLWAIAEGSVEQVGCIHTCQGLELDYVGVIVGPDLIVRDGKVVTDASKRSRMDQSIRGYKKWLKSDPRAARECAERIIKNTYRTLMTRGQKGCFVYCTDAETRAYFKSLLAKRQVSHAADSSVVSLFGDLPWEQTENSQEVSAIPVYDLEIAAGAFSEFQTPDARTWVLAPDHIAVTPDLFVARVVGESMNKQIAADSWCLFRANPGGSRNGRIVVATHHQIDDPDNGGAFTIKRYFSEKVASEDGELINARIVLRPESTDLSYEPIVLNVDDADEFKIVAEFLQRLN